MSALMFKRPWARALAFAALMLVALAPTRAEAGEGAAFSKDAFAPELRFSLGGAFIAPHTQSFGWVADDVVPRQDISVGLTPVRGLTLQLEYSVGRTSTYRAENLDVSMFSHGAGVRVRYALDCGSIIRPYLTSGFGANIGLVSVGSRGGTLKDRATTFFGDFAAGMEVQSRGKVSVGAYQDIGYALRTPYDFDGATREGGGPSVDLGDVQLRGVQYRIGVFVATEF